MGQWQHRHEIINHTMQITFILLVLELVQRHRPNYYDVGPIGLGLQTISNNVLIINLCSSPLFLGKCYELHILI